MNLKTYISDIGRKSTTRYFLFLLLVFLFVGHGTSLFEGPNSIHFIRQSDSLSFVLHYYLFDWSFFSPGTLNLESEGAKAACEFPVFYYFTAFIYLFTGVKIYLLKWIYVLVVYTGLFHFLKLAERILGNPWFALLTILPVLTSTVFHFYSFNYLPDAPAFGLTLSAFYFLSKWGIGLKKKGLYAFLLFTLAGLIKITFFIYPIAIFVLTLLLKLTKRESTFIKLEWKKTSLSILVSGGIVLLWNLYTYYYNQAHHSEYFLGEAKPYWTLSVQAISEVWSHIIDYWYTAYFAHTTYHFIGLIILMTLLAYRKIHFELGWLTIILGIGSLGYFILFFQQFQDHDYYLIVTLPFFLFLLIPILTALKDGKKWILILLCIAILGVCIPGLNYSRMKMKERRENRINLQSKMYFSVMERQTALQKLIGKSTVAIIGDPSKNGSLLALETLGWQVPLDQSFENWRNENKVTPDFVLASSHFFSPSEEWTIVYEDNELQMIRFND
ncbi:MAG: glycosyltransferase family 39 protein [Crocinitomicaceae bacterium]|nr:glycosyltransferase family 39 protein [Crocinitomicaceae bacterium]